MNMEKSIAVLIDDLFEDVEYSKPAEAFQKAGHRIIHIGLKKGNVVVGKKQQVKVCIDKQVDNVSVDDFDALFIPGGYSPDRLRVNDDAVRFVKDFVMSGKSVFSICHGPQLLITAQVLTGRRITGWKSIVQDLKNAGAVYIDQEVVEDGNLISSRSPADIPAFIKASLQKLQRS
jgi:protease I